MGQKMKKWVFGALVCVAVVLFLVTLLILSVANFMRILSPLE